MNESVVCTACLAYFNGTPRRSFLGFRKYTCPSCGKRILYPLTPGYRATYWVIAAIFSVLLFTGSIGLYPVAVLVGVIVALVKDVSIREGLKAATRKVGGT